MSDESTADTTALTNEEMQAQLAKLQEERDNYKNGMLAAKRKLKESGFDEPAEDIRTVIQEEVAKLSSTQAAELEALRKKNEELQNALVNTGSAPLAAGGSQPQPVENKEWTKEQLEYFERLKIDPKAVKSNIKPI